MTKSILVTGKQGQLGQSIAKIAVHYPQYRFRFVGRDELDLANDVSIDSFFAMQNQPFDVIINCAAYTAVDKAETETELANQVNHLAVERLAAWAKQQHSQLIHISTDYVFDGCGYRPYVETDPTDPQGVYGVTKEQGEQKLLNSGCDGYIVRTSWVYSEFGHNFVKTMLKLGKSRDTLNVIFDQVGSPTYATDLASACLALVAKPKTEAGVSLYHYSNEGVCSWYDFAHAIFDLAQVSCRLSPIESKDYPTPAKRPHYSLMNKAKIKQELDISIPYWKDSLKNCLALLED